MGKPERGQWYKNNKKINFPYLSTGSAVGDLIYEEILSKVLTMYSFTWIKKQNNTKQCRTSTTMRAKGRSNWKSKCFYLSHHTDANPDSAFNFDADPNPTGTVLLLMRIPIRYWFSLWSGQDPDPTFICSRVSPTGSFWNSSAPMWAYMVPLWASM